MISRICPTAGEPVYLETLGLKVTGVVSDNRYVRPGDVFVALPSLAGTQHGARFAADAVARGAVAVVTDAAGVGCAGALPIPVVETPDPRAIVGKLAAAAYRQPAARLKTFGVTGTNGKTTTAYQLEHLLGLLGHTCGLIGTVELKAGGQALPATLTTPEAADLQALLAVMVERQVTHLAMEVSSHSLVLGRVNGITFDCVGFTNLSADHLDFHGTMDNYLAAKAALFTLEHSRRAVVTVDSLWGIRLAQMSQVPTATLLTAPAGTVDYPLDQAPNWQVADVAPHGTGHRFTLRHQDGRALTTSVAAPGYFNVSNAALAVTMVIEAGASVEQVAAVLDHPGGLGGVVPGRMEVIGDGSYGSPRVIVDFAHNAEALELALCALRSTTTGSLIVVFGAPGDRDRTKRPLMGRVAVERADVVVVTDDDPHSEAPAAIRQEVLVGARAAHANLEHRGNVTLVEIASRAEAIAQAIADAQAGDTVLIAGRGHETIQEVGGVEFNLDDRLEARRALEMRGRR